MAIGVSGRWSGGRARYFLPRPKKEAGRSCVARGGAALGAGRVSCVVYLVSGSVSLLSALFGLIWELGVGRAKPAGKGVAHCKSRCSLLMLGTWHLSLGTVPHSAQQQQRT
jgi:hypothetical protein